MKNTWIEKGEFKDVPNDKLCCVFRQNGAKMGHVGWYYNGIAYHAHGHAYGVIATTNSEYSNWTHYAILPNLNVENDGNEVIPVLWQVKVISENRKLNVRSQPSSKSTILGRLEPQSTADVVAETSEEWLEIVYNGAKGYIMSKFVEKVTDDADDDPDEPNTSTYYIKIKCSSLAEAKIIQSALSNGAITEE